MKPINFKVSSVLSILNLKKNRMLSPKCFTWMLLSTAGIKADVLTIFFQTCFKTLGFFKSFDFILTVYSLFTVKTAILCKWLCCEFHLL